MNDTLARWIDAGELPVIDMAPLTRDAPGDEAAAMAALVQVGQICIAAFSRSDRRRCTSGHGLI